MTSMGRRGAEFGGQRCELEEGDMYQGGGALADADVVFAYATCFVTSDGVCHPRLAY